MKGAVKRPQKDYNTSFKLDVVKEIVSGTPAATDTYKKYGIQSLRNTVVNWLKKWHF